MSERARGRVDVTPSALVELMHAVYILSREGPKIELPWREHIAAHRPDLVDSIRSLPLQPADSVKLVARGYDLFWIAALAGYIADVNPDSFLERFPQLVDRAWVEWRGLVHSVAESPELMAARTVRLETFQDPDFQQTYVTLLRELWAEVGPMWEQDGLPIVQVECARIQQKLQEGEDILTLLPPKHFLTFEKYAQIVKDADVAHDLVITPLYFSQGGYLIDTEIKGLPLYVGYSPLHEGMHHATATKAADIAVKLKAFSDPTRLTLLATIAELDVTVGDLAKVLDITQPSVSGHLRLLEKAGLVTVKRRGVKAFYRANKAAIEVVLKEAGDLLR